MVRFPFLAVRSPRSSVLLAKAQCVELGKQVPLLYALLSLNTIAVSYTLRHSAPFWMTVICPGLLVCVSMIRLVTWLSSKPATDVRAARRMLRRVTALACLITFAFMIWALRLHTYAVGEERAHVSMFLAVTVIGCIFCLMHLPSAALAVTGLVVIPYLVFSIYQGDAIYLAIALNLTFVTLVLIWVLNTSFRGFEERIRARERAERLGRENMRLAHTDKLTDLPNRRFFFAELARRLERAKRDHAPVAVGVLDLDRFKPINDTYGHIVGDHLLEAVARRLRTIAESENSVVIGRLGGDEFGFVATLEPEAALAVGRRLCGALSAPFEIEDLVLSLGISCGLALSTDGEVASADLFKRADYALYQSKRHSRGQVCLYSDDHEREIRSEEALERALSTADLAAETELQFQPIVEFDTGRVQFVEALARWNSPTLGQVRPDLFIATAERMGLIHDLTLVLFRKAVAALLQMPADIRLSFNLSAQDVTNPPTVLHLVSIVRQSGIDPRRIVLELTETAVMRDFQQADESIALLRSLGMGIALDDFGTGYSSLSYLHRLPIDKVKIDRSFVRALRDMSGHNLLRSMLALCRSMKLECVIEGVETVEQLATLQSLGANAFQGYLFARPMPLPELLRWMNRDAAAGVLPARPDGRAV
ncbi:putative bifunctional diguanylate cyclase/phosphodiesterase [Aureimonas ureilytica]|uniref:putative bifunctional diguanylate cyclase/phosphodiesterase n=1 Tax=Aureimonas ureilytica TaxID=401562 RepID=UPI000365379A|nr:EAL domain-containing protein [Aureimonas ureilytica]